jgi:uncharacterized protein YbaP (TraB family)
VPYPRPALSRLLISVAGALALSGPAIADVTPTDVPFIWMIDSTPPSFLYGTVHVPDERVTTLPDIVTDAFEACDVLYTEIPMDPASQMKAAMAFMLTDGTLRDRLPDETWNRLDSFLKRRGMGAVMLNQLTPSAVAMQLMMVDDMDTFMSAEPLDALLETRAKAAGKTTRALETLDEQVEIFSSLSNDEQVKLLDDTLEQLEGFEAEDRNALEETVLAYLSGDARELSKLVHQFTDPDDPLDKKLMYELVTVRNQRMAERIAAHLTEEPDRVHFFAVGALHYPRPDGILALLRQQGFDVERLGPRDRNRVAEELGAPAR